MSTIYARASGMGRAGIAVIRVSGAQAGDTWRLLTGQDLPPPRQARVVTLKDKDVLLDQAMALYFQAPASFTGEDVVEYHVHGGRAVVEGMLQALGRIPGCRLAEPGEFTRRAFENGKIDLTAAEAVADLIDAETEAQRLQALDQLNGGLAQLYGGWTDRLKKLLAHQEADIEFPEDDLPVGIAETLRPQIQQLLSEMTAHLADSRRGERLRDGLRVAIIGAPNAGKSSLLNALIGREAAIVSDEAGTTRDVIEVHLDLGGYPVILADTAGLREGAGKIEREGIRRARVMAEGADLKIVLFDPAVPVDAGSASLVDTCSMVVWTKQDVASARPGTIWPCSTFSLSAQTGAGMDTFIAALTATTAEIFAARPGGPAPTRARHRQGLEAAQAALIRCLDAALPELAAEDLRLALRALGGITGKIHVEEVLDAVFRDFCIGK